MHVNNEVYEYFYPGSIYRLSITRMLIYPRTSRNVEVKVKVN